MLRERVTSVPPSNVLAELAPKRSVMWPKPALATPTTRELPGAGQLGADDRRVHGQGAGAATEQELRAAGAPRGEARGRERAA